MTQTNDKLKMKTAWNDDNQKRTSRILGEYATIGTQLLLLLLALSADTCFFS